MDRKVLFLVLCCVVGSGLCDSIEIDLKNFTPNRSNVYQSLQTLNDSTIKIKVKNVDPTVGFFIIQVHSLVENITLSYNSTISRRSSVTGTNIGLVYGDTPTKTTFYLYKDAKIEKKVEILVVIIVYDETAPVPGGCNLTFDNVVAPYQKVAYTDHVITVNSQPPSAYGVSCDVSDRIQVDFYHLYLKQYDNTVESYFNAITQLLSVDDIRANGVRVDGVDGYFKYHKLYSNYRGTGEVFVMIATLGNQSSAYIPAVSYGCDINNWDTNCIGPGIEFRSLFLLDLLVSDYWKFICALLLIFGLFTCFVGHKFFRFTLALMGFIFGLFVTFVGLRFDYHFTFEERSLISIVIGIIFGAVWVFIWWKFGMPFLSIHLAFILCGFLLASIVFYAGLADVYVYRNDINYWVSFSCVIIAFLIIWTSFTLHSHIFVCSTLGSYAAITALNHYAGGHLHYIVINTYRRMVVKDFNMAVVDPPFQLTDAMQTVLWGVMLGFGVFIQLRDLRGKPPFPPHRTGIIMAEPNERTPLIPAEQPSAPSFFDRV